MKSLNIREAKEFVLWFSTKKNLCQIAFFSSSRVSKEIRKRKILNSVLLSVFYECLSKRRSRNIWSSLRGNILKSPWKQTGDIFISIQTSQRTNSRSIHLHMKLYFILDKTLCWTLFLIQYQSDYRASQKEVRNHYSSRYISRCHHERFGCRFSILRSAKLSTNVRSEIEVWEIVV